MFGRLRNLYKNVDLIQDIFYKFRNVWLANKFSDVLIEAIQDLVFPRQDIQERVE